MTLHGFLRMHVFLSVLHESEAGQTRNTDREPAHCYSPVQRALMVKELSETDRGLNSTNQCGIRISRMSSCAINDGVSYKVQLRWSELMPDAIKTETWTAVLEHGSRDWVLKGMPSALQSHIACEPQRTKYLAILAHRVVVVMASLPGALVIDSPGLIDLFWPRTDPGAGEVAQSCVLCAAVKQCGPNRPS